MVTTKLYSTCGVNCVAYTVLAILISTQLFIFDNSLIEPLLLSYSLLLATTQCKNFLYPILLSTDNAIYSKQLIYCTYMIMWSFVYDHVISCVWSCDPLCIIMWSFVYDHVIPCVWLCDPLCIIMWSLVYDHVIPCATLLMTISTMTIYDITK